MSALRDAAGSVALILAAAEAADLPEPATAVAAQSGRAMFNFRDLAHLEAWAAWGGMAVGREWFTAAQDQYRAQGELMGVPVVMASWAERRVTS